MRSLSCGAGSKQCMQESSRTVGELTFKIPGLLGRGAAE